MTLELQIDSLDLEANGVARAEGKVVFVREALPGERVQVEILRRKPRFDVARTVRVLRESFMRVKPRCAHFGVCGGCSMQHLDTRAQVAIKQRVLEDQLTHLAGLRPAMMLRPIAGPDWGYRHRARLSVRHVPKKGGVLVGFHERGSSYVADMRECHVLAPQVARLLLPLRELIASLAMRDRMPQIEIALAGAPDDPVLALVFRVLDPVSDADRDALSAFASRHRLELWLQPKGPDSISLLWAPSADAAGRMQSRLGYVLPEFAVNMPFAPTDFTQVNHSINEALVSRAVRMLDPQPSERVADLFCGLGNFSLPLARRAGSVVGIEGSESLVIRARANALANGLAEVASFQAANLFEIDDARWQSQGHFDKLLIDPPREGALALCRVIAQQPRKHARIVYVSCNPATLARDAALLVHTGGYRLISAGVVNMFPHTSHVESIAVFEPAPAPAGPTATAAGSGPP